MIRIGSTTKTYLTSSNPLPNAYNAGINEKIPKKISIRKSFFVFFIKEIIEYGTNMNKIGSDNIPKNFGKFIKPEIKLNISLIETLKKLTCIPQVQK